MSDEAKGIIMGFVAITLFALTLPLTKQLTPVMHPMFIGLGRAVLAATVAAAILIASKQPLPNPQQYRKLLVVALGVVFGFPVLVSWALQTVPASHAGVVMGVAPLATVAAGVLLGSERPSRGFWLCAVCGAALVITFSVRDSVGGLAAGDLILLAAILCLAVGYAMGGILAKELGGWQVICWALVISLPLTVIPSWILAPDSIMDLSGSNIVAFLYLALVSQLFGFFLWYRAMALAGVVRVSQSQLLQPFVTIAASAVLLGETISTTTILFAIAVIATVAIGRRMPVHQEF